jgi:Na+/H+ antiporter NhaD/arsenite permease-like protein
MSGRFFALFAVAVLAPDAAQASVLDGATLSWQWAMPFAGILLTIALGPVVFARLWHRHYGKLTFFWAALTLSPMAALLGVDTAVAVFVYALFDEYMSFIALLFALYVVAGGILVTGTLRGNPPFNAATLAFGTLIASIVGTTGAAMILIRPLIRANAARLHNVHVVIFFIFLVGNIGGALSPLGDPPLFIGFLEGVDFFWPIKNLWAPTALVAGSTLAVFVAIDLWFYRKDRRVAPVGESPEPTKLGLRGRINILLLAVIIGAVVASASWHPGVQFTLHGTTLELQNLLRDAAMVLVALTSLLLTPNEHREANGFTWEPIIEVAILFAGIFICAAPVLAMLDAGHKGGAFAWLLAAISAPDGTPHETAYFWLTGLLSAVLDNAPTYLVFFKLAGGNAAELMGPLTPALAAISMGAVYMGALTYIGNAPNFMIYAIATERGIKMPSFFGYLVWSVVVLVPIFGLVTYVFLLARP